MLISKYSIEQYLISADKKINDNSLSKFKLITSCIYNLTLVSYSDCLYPCTVVNSYTYQLPQFTESN